MTLGDRNQNILCDTDCLAYFEEKALRHARQHKREGTEQLMIKKLDYVNSRITSLKAKKIALPFYKNAMAVLKK